MVEQYPYEQIRANLANVTLLCALHILYLSSTRHFHVDVWHVSDICGRKWQIPINICEKLTETQLLALFLIRSSDIHSFEKGLTSATFRAQAERRIVFPVEK